MEEVERGKQIAKVATFSGDWPYKLGFLSEAICLIQAETKRNLRSCVPNTRFVNLNLMPIVRLGAVGMWPAAGNVK